MTFRDLNILLPCHSLEDFPTYHEGTVAAGLLAAWTALWHPRLLAAAEKLPSWHRADAPPHDVAERLFVVPSASEPLLTSSWPTLAQDQGACVVRKLDSREAIVAAALADLGADARDLGPEIVADFHALGLSYLHVELLTRQMRYMSHVDEPGLARASVAAAKATVAGDEESARSHLQAAFDILTEARQRFYPVDAYLIDLTLVAPSTLGESLLNELAGPGPRNVYCPIEALSQIETNFPDTLTAFRSALARKSVSLVGGDAESDLWPLAPVEQILAGLRRHRAHYERLLGQPPDVYGRRRFGLTPVLPQILSRLGYSAALHFTLDDGQFPTGSQSKLRWEGLDGSVLDALTRLPLDAARAETFLKLPRKLGESMDRDHVATIMFAHWPGQASPYYDDLFRASKYAPVLGRVATLADYFSATDRPGELTRFSPDEYRSPFLRQAVAQGTPDPSSTVTAEHERQAQVAQRQTLDFLAEVVGQPSQASAETPGFAHHSGATLPNSLPDSLADDPALQRLASQVAQGTSSGQGGAWLAVNPHCQPRQVAVACGDPGPPSRPHTSGDAARQQLMLTVPAIGYAWGSPNGHPSRRRKEALIASDLVLRNEFLEALIHPQTGGLRSLYDKVHRTNRISQQLALRAPGPPPRAGDVWRDPDELAQYSTMVGQSFQIVENGSQRGAITARGRLTDASGRPHADFEQRYTLIQGSRVLLIETQLEVHEPPLGDPWNSYYASRFAWSDESSKLVRSVCLTAQPTTARRMEAPHFVEIRSGPTRTAVLTGGIPYQRLVGQRMLDTLLVVPGETRRSFRLGVGVDLPHVSAEAISLLQPGSPVLGPLASGSGSEDGWFFNIDSGRVVPTSWEALPDEGEGAGYRVRLLETEGLAGRIHLRSPRTVGSARQVDFLGKPLAELSADGDRVAMDLGPFEWAEIEVRWTRSDQSR